MRKRAKSSKSKESSQDTEACIEPKLNLASESQETYDQLKSNQDYIRQVCKIALKQIDDQRRLSHKLQQQNQIIYGTQEGSIGQLIEIPKYAYMFLKRLTEVMEASIKSVSRITLREYR